MQSQPPQGTYDAPARTGRGRMALALLVSAALHGLFLSMTFGDADFGLPGLNFFWRERRVEVSDLRVELVRPPSPAVIRPETPAIVREPRPVVARPRPVPVVTPAAVPVPKQVPRPDPVAEPVPVAAIEAQPVKQEPVEPDPPPAPPPMPKLELPERKAEPDQATTARVEAERREAAARVEAAREEKERRELERQELARREAERQEADRREAERREAARIEAERRATELEAQRLEMARREAARLEAERREAARLEAERREAARLEAERQEALRLEAAKLATARAEEERREARLRAIGRQLDEERAQREARSNLPQSLSTARRLRLWGRSDANGELVRYAEAWTRRIQLNTSPETVRDLARRPHGNPMVTVAMRSDGTVESVTIVQTSGVPEVDQAVIRIVQNQAPYPAFSPALARQADVIEIRRTWYFDVAVRLE